MSNTVNNYTETDLGNISLNPRGEYDDSAAYEYLDTVSYQGGSYFCLAELETTITGIAPDAGRNSEYWQMIAAPGDMTPEYTAAYNDVINKAVQVETSRAAVELAQQEIETSQANVQELHSDTVQVAQEAENSKNSAANSAQSAEQSKNAASESEQNVNNTVAAFDDYVEGKKSEADAAVNKTKDAAIKAVTDQQSTSVQEVKDQTASYIAEKETSSKTEIRNYTSEKITEINKKTSEANTTLANTIADGTAFKTQLETTISTADTSKKNLDASNTTAGKTKTALDTSNTTATKTKADLDTSNTTASETKTGLDATNKTAVSLVTSLGDKITEGTRVKNDIQTTGETAISNLQTEAAKQQEYIKTSIDDTLSISGKAADAAVTGKKISSLKEDLSNKITKFYASNQGETHITDSDNGKTQDMMLYGKSEQKQYRGKNLINSDEYYSKYKQNDGTYKGKASEFNKILVPISKYIGTQITVSCKVTVPLDTTSVLIEATINGAVTKGNRIESGKSGVIALTISPRTESDTIKITYGDGGDGIVVASEFQIEKGSEVTPYEPYVGGQPSPSPNYPQRIKSVVNPTVKVTNEDESKVQSVTLNNIILNAIPVSSGGNVTIGEQQYISDYVDIEKGKLYRKVKRLNLKDVDDTRIVHGFHSNGNGYLSISVEDIKEGPKPISNRYKSSAWTDKSGYTYIPSSNGIIFVDDRFTDRQTAIKLVQDTYVIYALSSQTEEDLSLEQVKSLKSLSTYYPTTNISVNSEQLDGYTVFNYPISIKNGWDYVKKQLNDNRDYIYDMDLQSAEAYVNSEYAVALTELEV